MGDKDTCRTKSSRCCRNGGIYTAWDCFFIRFGLWKIPCPFSPEYWLSICAYKCCKSTRLFWWEWGRKLYAKILSSVHALGHINMAYNWNSLLFRRCYRNTHWFFCQTAMVFGMKISKQICLNYIKMKPERGNIIWLNLLKDLEHI